MNVKNNFRHTVYASYISYITQSIVNNFLPLLFVMFNTEYNISLGNIGLLVSLNFLTQMCVDLLAAKYASKIGYRPLVIASHISATLGLVALGILPDLLSNAYVGLCISVVLCAIGGGLSEALISPIIEFCPLDNKSGEMSLLHSFYCWGCVLVIAASTALFAIFGMDSWKYVSIAWALVPLLDIFYFAVVPMPDITQDKKTMSILGLFGNKLFWVFAILMIGAGASELAMSQWASAFAETGLKVSKTVGDIAGPCMFALLMGLSRVFYAKVGNKIPLPRYLMMSSLLCVAGYLMSALSPVPVISLIGCGICGLSVGVMWPGVYSYASEIIPRGGTTMFALLALAGDIGCSIGPSFTGYISKAFDNNLSVGLLASVAFPIVIIAGLLIFRSIKKAD